MVGYPHPIKGEGIYVYATLNAGVEATDELMKDLGQVSERLANRNEGHTPIDRLRDELNRRGVEVDAGGGAGR